MISRNMLKEGRKEGRKTDKKCINESVTAVGNPGLHLTGHFLRHCVKHVSELSYWELRTLRYLYTNSHPLSVQGHYEERAKVNTALLKSPTCRPSKLLRPESALWQRVVWELFTSNFQGRGRGCGCSNSILLVLLSGCFFMCEFHFTNRNVNSLNAWATAYSIYIASPMNSGNLLATGRLNPLSPPWPGPSPDALSRLLFAVHSLIPSAPVTRVTSRASSLSRIPLLPLSNWSTLIVFRDQLNNFSFIKVFHVPPK